MLNFNIRLGGGPTQKLHKGSRGYETEGNINVNLEIVVLLCSWGNIYATLRAI